MQILKAKRRMLLFGALVIAAFLGGCATTAQMQSLEERMNALQAITEKAGQSANQAQVAAQESRNLSTQNVEKAQAAAIRAENAAARAETAAAKAEAAALRAEQSASTANQVANKAVEAAGKAERIYEKIMEK